MESPHVPPYLCCLASTFSITRFDYSNKVSGADDGHVIERYDELAEILELTDPRNDNTRRVAGGGGGGFSGSQAGL